jgi:GAF domain-containing protein
MAAHLNVSAVVTQVLDRTRNAAKPGNLQAALAALTTTIVELAIADCAGVTERVTGQMFQTHGATDERVTTLDKLQYELNEGPCVEATYDHDDLLVSNDIGRDPRWPTWGPLAVREGVCSVISANLHTSETAMGALNLYRFDTHHHVTDDLIIARLVATQASIVLGHYRSETHLWKAIDSRQRIGQAQGVLMERYKIDADQAFQVLRRLSQNHNIKLHLIAHQIVTTGVLPE